jgi:hypothetical protein
MAFGGRIPAERAAMKPILHRKDKPTCDGEGRAKSFILESYDALADKAKDCPTFGLSVISAKPRRVSATTSPTLHE